MRDSNLEYILSYSCVDIAFTKKLVLPKVVAVLTGKSQVAVTVVASLRFRDNVVERGLILSRKCLSANLTIRSIAHHQSIPLVAPLLWDMETHLDTIVIVELRVCQIHQKGRVC
jgi:hypothetical protein